MKAPIRKVLMSTTWIHPTIGDAVCLHLECGHKLKFTTRDYRSRVSKKVPTKKACYDCLTPSEPPTTNTNR